MYRKYREKKGAPIRRCRRGTVLLLAQHKTVVHSMYDVFHLVVVVELPLEELQQAIQECLGAFVLNFGS